MVGSFASALDLSKVYEPNPPTTNRIFMTVRFFDSVAKKLKEQEITIDIYGTVVPKTAFNFAALAEGVKARIQGQDPDDIKVLGYQGTKFTKVISNGLMLGGDIIPEIGPFSVHGPAFPDENFFLKHDRPGRVAMANNGPDSNNSQFYISLKLEPATELDDRDVVFGQVVSGLEGLLDGMKNVELGPNNKPVKDVEITYCVVSELKLADKDALHTAYIEKVTKFKQGDQSKGQTMKQMLAEGSKKKTTTKKSKASGKSSNSILGFQPIQILYGILGLAALVVLLRIARKYFSRSSNVVSMRTD